MEGAGAAAGRLQAGPAELCLLAGGWPGAAGLGLIKAAARRLCWSLRKVRMGWG